MIISANISKTLMEITGEPRADIAILEIIEDAVEHRIEKISAEIKGLEEKYSMTFGEFKKRFEAGEIPEAFSYEVETDYLEWEGLVSRLNKFRPDDLRGYASGLMLLASEQLAGRLDIHPTNIVSSAEPLDDKARRVIEEAFGVTPYNFYAASESIGIVQDCSEHQGLHVFNDQHVLELLNEKNEPVKPGYPGQVVLNNLYNRCQPLIRYRMNDVAIYSDEECDCGLPFPLLKGIIGRQEEVIWVENNSGGYETIHSMVFIEFFVPGLRRLQVLQEERNRIRLKLVTDGDKEAILTAVTRRMEEILSGKNLLGQVTFDLEPVNLIAPDRKTGKTKTVISAVGPPKES